MRSSPTIASASSAHGLQPDRSEDAMKKKSKRLPSRASVREIPEVDFGRYGRGRRNPFASRIRREGWELVHDGPSKASLREMPEIARGTRGRANPYSKRLKARGVELQVGRGRPSRKGPTEVKSVRLPPSLWKQLEAEAAVEGIALHALVRAALVRWLNRRRVA